VVGVASREVDDLGGAALLFEPLENPRPLADQALRREHRIGFVADRLGGVSKQSRELVLTGAADGAGTQMLTLG
jgi:hypothetical protein